MARLARSNQRHQGNIAPSLRTQRLQGNIGAGHRVLFFETLEDRRMLAPMLQVSARIFERPADYPLDAAGMRVEATQEIETVEVGQDFVVKLFVEDVRLTNPKTAGVFSAYVDVMFSDGALAWVIPDLAGGRHPQSQPGSPFLHNITDFGNGISGSLIDTSGDQVPDQIDGIGSFTGRISGTGWGELVLAEWAMTAATPGVLEFTPESTTEDPRMDPYDARQSPFLATGVFGENEAICPAPGDCVGEMRFVSDSIVITGDRPIEFPLSAYVTTTEPNRSSGYLGSYEDKSSVDELPMSSPAGGSNGGAPSTAPEGLLRDDVVVLEWSIEPVLHVDVIDAKWLAFETVFYFDLESDHAGDGSRMSGTPRFRSFESYDPQDFDSAIRSYTYFGSNNTISIDPIARGDLREASWRYAYDSRGLTDFVGTYAIDLVRPAVPILVAPIAEPVVPRRQDAGDKPSNSSAFAPAVGHQEAATRAGERSRRAGDVDRTTNGLDWSLQVDQVFEDLTSPLD